MSILLENALPNLKDQEPNPPLCFINYSLRRFVITTENKTKTVPQATTDSELFTRHCGSFDMSVHKASESTCSMVNGERDTHGARLQQSLITDVELMRKCGPE